MDIRLDRDGLMFFLSRYNNKIKMGKLVTILVVVLALLAFETSANQCNFSYGRQHPWLLEGFCMHQCADPIYSFCPALINIPTGGKSDEYCGEKNNTFANFTTLCEACNMKYESIYYGHCSCSFMQCPAGHYCKDGNCFKNPTCDEITCGANQ